jgi:hypothetical protein
MLLFFKWSLNAHAIEGVVDNTRIEPVKDSSIYTIGKDM